jgi:serine/threonine protein phosphatase PrpC
MLPSKPTKVVAILQTDVGMVREHNEDNAHADPEGMFFVVADGMGGHAAGEVASAMAVEEVQKALASARAQVAAFAAAPGEEGRGQLVQLLEEAVRRAHQAVFERGGRETDKKGMGTTLDVLLVAGGEAFVAHVGDSRTYLLRGGNAAQVTTDHTVAEVLVIEGKLSPEEARLSPLRTILVNAIGVSPDVGVELAHLKLRRGDLLLLCSDGMHDYFPTESEIADVLKEHRGAEGLNRLVEMAKDRGGHDNITGVLVDVVTGNPTVEEEEAEARRLADELAKQSPEDRAAAPAALLAVEETAPHEKKDRQKAPPDGTAPPAPLGKDASAAAPASTWPPPVGADGAQPGAADVLAAAVATARTEEIKAVHPADAAPGKSAGPADKTEEMPVMKPDDAADKP